MQVIYDETETIIIRPLELSDEPTLRKWINDPRVRATLNHRPPMNEMREREWIESLYKSDRDYEFGIVAKESGKLIGTCGLHGVSAINRTVTYGLMIGDVDAWGKGYDTDATRWAVRYGFNQLNLNRINLHVLANNLAAIRVYEKAGFVREGTSRQAIFRDGKYIDIHWYAVLRDEWSPS